MRKIGGKIFDVAFSALLIFTFVGFIIVVTEGLINSAWRKEAVDKGYAEWYIEHDTKEWRWKTPHLENAPNSSF